MVAIDNTVRNYHGMAIHVYGNSTLPLVPWYTCTNITLSQKQLVLEYVHVYHGTNAMQYCHTNGTFVFGHSRFWDMAIMVYLYCQYGIRAIHVYQNGTRVLYHGTYQKNGTNGTRVRTYVPKKWYVRTHSSTMVRVRTIVVHTMVARMVHVYVLHMYCLD